jgi:hypothetical protein
MSESEITTWHPLPEFNIPTRITNLIYKFNESITEIGCHSVLKSERRPCILYCILKVSIATSIGLCKIVLVFN